MLNDLKAEFSHAYVRAVTHAAGFFVQESNRMLDDNGVDLTMFSRDASGTIRSPRLDVQLKATAGDATANSFPFDLAIKNYDELRSLDLQVPRILVVVVVPQDTADWVTADEQALILRRCGYWVSLRGEPTSANTATVRVQISGDARFHVEQVQAIMERVRGGGLP